MRELAAEIKQLERGAGGGRGARSRSCCPRCPTCPTRRRPTATPRRTRRSCGRSASRRSSTSSRATTSTSASTLGVIDMESAARASGSRFAYLKGDLVLVELALVRLAFDRLGAHGFVPVSPPVLVREEPLFWTGFLPTDRAQIYEIAGDDLYPGRDLRGEPRRPARRRDPRRGRSAAALRRASRPASGARPVRPGRDTRGIFRVHQFDKVEMFSFVRPERLRRRARADPARIQEEILRRPRASRTGW